MMDADCPLCCKKMDATDQSFKPCRCGYQICLWCYHKIMESDNRKCPACRTPYSPDKSKQVMSKKLPKKGSKDDNSRDRDRDRERDRDKSKDKDRERDRENRKEGKRDRSKRRDSRSAHPNLSFEELSHVRVRQKNLVYVVGLPAALCDESLLRSNKWFGKYGKIKKVYCNRKSVHPTKVGSYQAFVTFYYAKDAMRAIEATNGLQVDETRMLRATHGSTKYCSYFLHKQTCVNPGCLYLHDWARPEDVVTKEELNDFAPTSGATHQTQGSPPTPIAAVTLKSSRAAKLTSRIAHYDYTKKNGSIASSQSPRNVANAGSRAQSHPHSATHRNQHATTNGQQHGNGVRRVGSSHSLASLSHDGTQSSTPPPSTAAYPNIPNTIRERKILEDCHAPPGLGTVLPRNGTIHSQTNSGFSTPTIPLSQRHSHSAGSEDFSAAAKLPRGASNSHPVFPSQQLSSPPLLALHENETAGKTAPAPLRDNRNHKMGSPLLGALASLATTPEEYSARRGSESEEFDFNCEDLGRSLCVPVTEESQPMSFVDFSDEEKGVMDDESEEEKRVLEAKKGSHCTAMKMRHGFHPTDEDIQARIAKLKSEYSRRTPRPSVVETWRQERETAQALLHQYTELPDKHALYPYNMYPDSVIFADYASSSAIVSASSRVSHNRSS